MSYSMFPITFHERTQLHFDGMTLVGTWRLPGWVEVSYAMPLTGHDLTRQRQWVQHLRESSFVAAISRRPAEDA